MLIDYFPGVLKKIREMQEICQAEQPEFDNIGREVDRVLANMLATTADEHGIARLEEELGIVPIPGQKLEERRAMVLIRMVKRNLSFREIVGLMQKYSPEINLMPDYAAEELEVAIGDQVRDTRSVYRMLDDLISLNIFIYLSHEDFMSLMESEAFLEEMALETDAEICNDAKLFHELEAGWETSVEVAERFEDIAAVRQHNLWHLDGSVVLDGSRVLDAEEVTEEL